MIYSKHKAKDWAVPEAVGCPHCHIKHRRLPTWPYQDCCSARCYYAVEPSEADTRQAPARREHLPTKEPIMTVIMED